MPKKIDVNKVSEEVDYQFVPVEEVENEQAWDIRILRGPFVESVIRFGQVAFDGERDCLTFNFHLVYSPDEDLTTDNKEFQEFAADILEDILETAYHEGWLVTKERE